MGRSSPAPELSLDFKPSFIPKTIGQFLGEVARIGSVSEKILKVDDFVNRLETEMRKIDAFKRELPLCMLLINDAIVTLKDELMAFKKSSNLPVLEEFIPLKKNCDEDAKVEIDNGDKKNWLSTTQLWNTNDNNSDANQNHNQVIQKRSKEEQDVTLNDPYCGNSGGSFMPFKGYCGFTVVGTKRNEDKEEMTVPGLSLVTPGIKNLMRGNGLLTKTGANSNSRLVPCSITDVQSKIRIGTPQSQASQQQTSRKQRRCWSTVLHRRFVNALQQLGGSKVATPKQIRELMRVDGLTNDEVKSHLQKYRLHTRRFPSSNTSSSPSNIVLNGGLWMNSKDQYTIESSKDNNSQSGSPDGPLLNNSTTGGDSMDDGEDDKSENNCWKGHLHTPDKNTV